ncbi:MAG: efflux RND transporter permease subunit, partial [bacterium]|nr:efflux RND transporter permease subunit [bacterium]
VDRAAAGLPHDLPQKPLVDEMSSSKLPVMEIHVTGSVPEETLRRTARQLEAGLREVEGIAGVDKVGYRKREVRILLDPERVQRLGISYGEIIDAVARRNVRDSGGSLESFVAEKKVLTVGQFEHPKEVEEVIIRATDPGNFVRVRDVAEVVLDYEDWVVQSRADGHTGIALLPRKKSAADGLDTSRAVREFVEEARGSTPAGVELTVVNDISRFTYDMLKVLVGNAIMGFLLVVAVLLAFFNLRLALWVAVGLPVAIAITAALMPLCGLGVDVMTLMALILVMGMLVDDAIVTGESIYRFREAGLPAAEASIRGATAVARPVFVSTATTVLALAPAAFLGGLEGKFMWALPVMVLLTLAGSLIECQLMLPAHLAHGRSSPKTKQWFEAVQRLYDRFIHRMIARRYLTIGAFAAGALLIVVWGALTINFNLYPEMDIDVVFLKVELPEGSSFQRTGEKVRELEDLARELVPADDLLNVTTQIGHHDTDVYGAQEGRNPAWALVTMFLQPQGDRQVDSNDVVAELRARIRDLSGYRSIIVRPIEDTPVAGKPVELEIIGNDDSRYELAEIVSQYLESYPGVTEVWTSYRPGKDVVHLKLDHEALGSRGLTVAGVTEAV